MVGHRIECGARAAGVGQLGRYEFWPAPSIAWMALGGDVTYGVLPPHEVGDREEHIPSHDPSIEETMGQDREEAHIISVRIEV